MPLHEIRESAVRGEPGDAATVPVQPLTEDQEGRTLVLIEGDGEQLHHGDVVTIDTDVVKTPAAATDAPAAALPQIAVACPRCDAPG